MKKILLDSSVIIDLLRRENKEKSLLYQLTQKDYDFSVSIITHSELYSGKSIWEKEQAKQELEIVLSGVDTIPLNKEISQKAGQIRAEHSINLLDAIIAATAIYYDLDLVTFNIKDFEKVSGIHLFVSEE